MWWWNNLYSYSNNLDLLVYKNPFETYKINLIYLDCNPLRSSDNLTNFGCVVATL